MAQLLARPSLPIILVAVALVSAIALPAARAAAEKGDGIVPKSLVGLKMKFTDLHGKYTVSFSDDRTYSFVTTRENEKPDMRKGSYKWHVKDNRNAVLDLGDDEVYSLKFQSTTQATGQVTDDVRTYKFTFSK